MQGLAATGWRLALGALAALGLMCGAASAQKRGGIMTVPIVDGPPSASIHEEATVMVVVAFMPMFNNLVIYDQHTPQNRPDTIRPELADKWAWSADNKALTFTLHQGVKWHDGKPFTSADVKCTWDMVSGLTPGKIRRSPRQEWYGNLESISVNGDYEVTFHLKRPQPSLLAMLASGYSPVYPCHIPSAQMRTRPIGTGPFRFVEYRTNEVVKLERNPDYWKPGLPYLDGIEGRVTTNQATRNLAFVAKKFDVTFPSDLTVALTHDIQSQVPDAQCTIRMIGNNNLMVNREKPPFDNPDIRRALALTLDHRAFSALMDEGKDGQGATMMPAPDGVWGMPPDMLAKLPGYDPDPEKSREEGRALMRKAGFGPDNHLKVKVFTRNIPTFREPALILADHLKHIYIDAELEVVETAIFVNRVYKRDYSVGMNSTGASLDDPDQPFYEFFACGSLRNYSGYCSKEVEGMIDRQSEQLDPAKRRSLVWEIERRIADDVARPVTYHSWQAGCWHSYVKNYNIMVNSLYNGWRWEDVWLDK